ncbi:class F sortase [Streptomyces sp. DSM 44915]|uniref:Class F sortase n=1 Tax=Streptomyces chisholmiae TaxID=3075540 RepID=A0ABU2JLW0_9ACTN|nr:class F sortase [Streptomyces sp. DSM 44915]MDT0265967.1 class F sortase [Streptomyces sp. DSM 44915]
MRLPDPPPPDQDPWPDEPMGWGTKAVLGLLAGTVVLGLTIMAGALHGEAGPPQPATGGTASAPPTGAAGPVGQSEPTWVTIPAIDVDAPLTSVGLDPEGWVDAPPQEVPNLAGWYRDAASPGAAGTAVLVGHVDNAAGPAVFYGLGELRPGDTVDVVREDGREVTFTVYETAIYDKYQLPERVYQDTERPELRLITCGGDFEPGTGGYRANVVVYATLTGTT